LIHRGGNRISRLSPRDALRYNAHPDRLLREVPEEDWGSVLRAIDREASQWVAQRTLEQTAWLAERRGKNYRGPLSAAKEIVAARKASHGEGA
jgi:hypothetical protein